MSDPTSTAKPTIGERIKALLRGFDHRGERSKPNPPDASRHGS